MVSMVEIVERVKEVLFDEYKGKVLDKNVAYELGVTPSTLASQKSRELLPYDELTLFCLKRKISVHWLLFGIGEKEVQYA